MIYSEKQIKAFDKEAIHPLQTWEWGEFRKEWGNKVVRKKITKLSFPPSPKPK